MKFKIFQKEKPVLVRIPLNRLIVDEFAHQEDETVIFPHLVYTINKIQKLHFIPTVRKTNNNFRVITDVNYVRALKEAVANIKQVECVLFIREGDIDEEISNMIVPMGEITTTLDDKNAYERTILVFFAHPLSHSEKEVFIETIEAFYKKLQENPSLGGGFKAMLELTFESDDRIAVWKFTKSDTEGEYMTLFFQLLSDFSRKYVKVLSVNGRRLIPELSK